MKSIIPGNIAVFFDKNGISISEANHLANISKTLGERIHSKINSTSSAKETMDYDGNPVVISNPEKINFLEECQKEGKLYTLSAWLREAIKSKEEGLKILKNANTFSFLKDDEKEITFDITAPKIEVIKQAPVFTENDVISEFTIAERAEYFSLEAEAAHIGKYIHSGSILEKISKDVTSSIKFRFNRIEDRGQRDLPVKREFIYTQEEIDKQFYTLQSRHRELESKLNWYKARIKNILNEKQSIAKKEYSKKIEEVNSIYNIEKRKWDTLYSDFSQKREAQINELESRRLYEINLFASLKVVIPNSLKDIYEYISKV